MRFTILLTVIVFNFLAINYIQELNISSELKYILFFANIVIMPYIYYRIVLPSIFIKAIKTKKEYDSMINTFNKTIEIYEESNKKISNNTLPDDIEEDVIRTQQKIVENIDDILNNIKNISNERKKVNDFVDNFSIVKNLFSFSNQL